MKRTAYFWLTTLTVVLSVLTSQKISAQQVYTSSDFASVGDSFVVSQVPLFNLTGFDFTDTDTSYTWDFSTLNPTSQRIASYQTPGSTGFQVSYLFTCNTNCYTPCYNNCVNGGTPAFLCQSGCTVNCGATCLSNWNNKFNLAELVNDSLNLGIVTITDVFNLYKKSSSALEQNAIGVRVSNIPLVVEHSRSDEVYHFPMNYGDSTVSESAYSIQLDSIPGTGINFSLAYRHAQTRTNLVNGWGSLITPFMQFDSVLKVTSIVHNRDSVVFQGNTITLNDFLPNEFIPDTVVTYQWFSKDWGIPVLKVTAWRVNGTEIYQEAEFIDTVRCFDPVAIFGYLPIPATLENGSDSAEVNFYNASINANTFSWDFDDPNSVANTSGQQSPAHYFTEEGVYNVTLTVCNTACAFPRCDDLSIPVLIIDNRDTTTGIIPDEKKIEQLKLYPVPFTDHISVDIGFEGPQSYKIYDMSGKLVYSASYPYHPGMVTIDLSEIEGTEFILIVKGVEHTASEILVRTK